MASKNGSRAGGGIKSNKLVHPKVQTGVRGREIRPQGVAQIGSSIGNHATEHARKLTGGVEKVRGELRPPGGPSGVMLGNQKALDVGKGGVGTGRDVSRCGSQGTWGQPNPGLGRIANTKGQWPD
jgi:hypothetical protein